MLDLADLHGSHLLVVQVLLLTQSLQLFDHVEVGLCAVGAATLELRQELLQASDLVFVLFEKCVLWVFIHFRFVLDLLGSISVPERGQRLLVIVVGRGEGCNHNRLGVTAKRVLQESSQIGVTVRDMP